MDHLKTAAALAQLLDSQFKIFNFRFGLDPLLGLIPGVGDFLGLCLASYIVWIGYQQGLPKLKISQMIGNIILDFAVGTIPIIGDFFDVTYKANLKNLEIIRNHRPE